MSLNPQVNDDVHLPSTTKSCHPVFGPEPPPSQDMQEILALTKNLAFARVKNEMEAELLCEKSIMKETDNLTRSRLHSSNAVLMNHYNITK